MVVASQSWELSLPGCSSLKAKRAVVRSLRDRITARFKVSVAETGLQDVHARAEVSVALVASDAKVAESILTKIDSFVESHGGALIVRVDREFYR